MFIVQSAAAGTSIPVTAFDVRLSKSTAIFFCWSKVDQNLKVSTVFRTYMVKLASRMHPVHAYNCLSASSSLHVFLKRKIDTRYVHRFGQKLRCDNKFYANYSYNYMFPLRTVFTTLKTQFSSVGPTRETFCHRGMVSTKHYKTTRSLPTYLTFTPIVTGRNLRQRRQGGTEKKKKKKS